MSDWGNAALVMGQCVIGVEALKGKGGVTVPLPHYVIPHGTHCPHSIAPLPITPLTCSTILPTMSINIGINMGSGRRHHDRSAVWRRPLPRWVSTDEVPPERPDVNERRRRSRRPAWRERGGGGGPGDLIHPDPTCVNGEAWRARRDAARRARRSSSADASASDARGGRRCWNGNRPDALTITLRRLAEQYHERGIVGHRTAQPVRNELHQPGVAGHRGGRSGRSPGVPDDARHVPHEHRGSRRATRLRGRRAAVHVHACENDRGALGSGHVTYPRSRRLKDIARPRRRDRVVHQSGRAISCTGRGDLAPLAKTQDDLCGTHRRSCGDGVVRAFHHVGYAGARRALRRVPTSRGGRRSRAEPGGS